MSIVVMFFAILAGLAGWWLARQRLTAKPWLEQGVIEGVPDFQASRDPAKRVGLGFLLAVVGSLFALLTGAYFMRRELGDWQPLPVPPILWFNTAMLVASSLALEWTQRAVHRGSMPQVRGGLAAAGLFAVTFLAGQVLAWGELSSAGYIVAGNPANSFFYLVTGLHGLHILGGLVAVGWAGRKAWGRGGVDSVRLNVELCATYWLFMLFVWMVLLSLLAGWASDFVAFCQQLLS
ncbi:MAG TPA: cytochrome c oxidase subunit 3 [Devosia sp.]|jgi:cytochrome c oxidase subunit 3|uniref:cytochrome c oxidase subunit 3 n=1 Tax=Devosia sp. TaxID=1871048 RepID=UPI002DDCA47A|nr:cytochrome c oxidase subunit 3 [Devosia sp.]HEV2514427.1 cytochrome c oxidase subunit 3 [Devosia sp.]